MDIFDEIKEAVLSATPGEDTRNFYRNQGITTERERIISLLESYIPDEPGTTIISAEWAIALIKGEK